MAKCAVYSVQCIVRVLQCAVFNTKCAVVVFNAVCSGQFLVCNAQGVCRVLYGVVFRFWYV